MTVEGAIALGADLDREDTALWEKDGEPIIRVFPNGYVVAFDVADVPITTMGQLALLLSLLGLGDNSLDSRIAEAITTASRDIEANHAAADDLLVEIVGAAKFTKTVAAFEKLDRWYS